MNTLTLNRTMLSVKVAQARIPMVSYIPEAQNGAIRTVYCNCYTILAQAKPFLQIRMPTWGLISCLK